MLQSTQQRDSYLQATSAFVRSIFQTTCHHTTPNTPATTPHSLGVPDSMPMRRAPPPLLALEWSNLMAPQEIRPRGQPVVSDTKPKLSKKCLLLTISPPHHLTTIVGNHLPASTSHLSFQAQAHNGRPGRGIASRRVNNRFGSGFGWAAETVSDGARLGNDKLTHNAK